MNTILAIFMGICLLSGYYVETDINQEITYIQEAKTGVVLFGESCISEGITIISLPENETLNNENV